jgi:hypothetical protein
MHDLVDKIAVGGKGQLRMVDCRKLVIAMTVAQAANHLHPASADK